MTLIFKEWSYIVDALGKGLQSLILRKGGISEEEGRFTLKGNKFLLLPTLFHQAEQMVKPEWLPKLDGSRFYTNANEVTIEYYAEVAMQKVISDWETVQKLDPQHAWKEEVIAERFHRGEQNVSLIIVQVYKLKTPLILPLLPEYGGCKSWIEIAEDVDLVGTPVIYEKIKGTYF